MMKQSKITRYDSEPLSKDDKMAMKVKWYQELESEIIGLSEIAQMDDRDSLITADIIKTIRRNKDSLEKVRSKGDDTIGVVLEEGIGENKVVKIMIDLAGLNPNDTYLEDGEITLCWY